mgnify:CR=1 FL=1
MRIKGFSTASFPCPHSLVQETIFLETHHIDNALSIFRPEGPKPPEPGGPRWRETFAWRPGPRLPFVRRTAIIHGILTNGHGMPKEKDLP